MQPGREPTADVAAARNGREVIELLQEVVAREPLDESERERAGAYAAARKTERLRADGVQTPVDGREADIAQPLQVVGEGLFEQEAVEVVECAAEEATGGGALLGQSLGGRAQPLVAEAVGVVEVGVFEQAVERVLDGLLRGVRVFRLPDQAEQNLVVYLLAQVLRQVPPRPLVLRTARGLRDRRRLAAVGEL